MLREEKVITAVGFSVPWGEGFAGFVQRPLSKNEGPRELPTYNVSQRLPERGLRYLSAVTKLFCTTALQAIDSAGTRAVISGAASRVGIYHGADSPHLEDVMRFDLAAKHEGPGNVSPMASPNTLPNAAAGELAIRLAIEGPSVTVACGPTSGVQALDVACLHLDSNTIDYAIVGSVEVASMYHQSLWRSEGAVPRCPELGVVLCVEPGQVARKQGRPVLGQLLGTACAALRDPLHLEASLTAAVAEALQGARLDFDDLDLVVVAGADPALDDAGVGAMLAERGCSAPVTALDPACGQTENTGGLLGVLWALALFRSGEGAHALWQVERIGAEKAARAARIAVCSTDVFGNSSAVILARPERTT